MTTEKVSKADMEALPVTTPWGDFRLRCDGRGLNFRNTNPLFLKYNGVVYNGLGVTFVKDDDTKRRLYGNGNWMVTPELFALRRLGLQKPSSSAMQKAAAQLAPWFINWIEASAIVPVLMREGWTANVERKRVELAGWMDQLDERLEQCRDLFARSLMDETVSQSPEWTKALTPLYRTHQ